jgi:hypothetical protein
MVEDWFPELLAFISPLFYTRKHTKISEDIRRNHFVLSMSLPGKGKLFLLKGLFESGDPVWRSPSRSVFKKPFSAAPTLVSCVAPECLKECQFQPRLSLRAFGRGVCDSGYLRLMTDHDKGLRLGSGAASRKSAGCI